MDEINNRLEAHARNISIANSEAGNWSDQPRQFCCAMVRGLTNKAQP